MDPKSFDPRRSTGDRARQRLPALAAAVALLSACSSSGPTGASTPAPPPKPMRVGAAVADITPPPLGMATPASFATCDLTKYTGPRAFSFEEPYVDTAGTGKFAAGDAFCDANANGFHDGMYLGGGRGNNRVPTKVLDPLNARAVVFGTADGKRNVAMIVVDSLGILDPTVNKIVAGAKAARPGLNDVLVSSTHSESAPDPIGLWGPDQMTTGRNDYYADFLASQAVQAVGQAYDARVPARLRFAEGAQPDGFQPVWSSYPFVHDPSVMAMQGVRDDDPKKTIFTLANYGFHAEGYGYSNDPSLTLGISADWPAVTRGAFESKYGGVGVCLAGLIGTVETPAVYPGGGVPKAPVPPTLSPSAGYTVFAAPAGGMPLPAGTVEETTAIGNDIASSVTAAFDAAPNQWSQSTDVRSLAPPLCVTIENQNFVAGIALKILPTPAMCHGDKVHMLSAVAVLDVGDAQIAYAPGEVFPFTFDRSFLGPNDMPFPQEPMTPWVSAAMTGKYTFFAGLGEDMLGYIMPAGDFVGDPGEVTLEPWATYTKTHTHQNDRLGYTHGDDPESVGPNAAMPIAQALISAIQALDPGGAPNTTVSTGRFIDDKGRTSRSPFSGASFSGAVGVWVLPSGGTSFTPGTGSVYTLAGHASAGPLKATAAAGGFIDIHGLPQAAGYSVATRGVWLTGAAADAPPQRVFVDVYPGP
jgi:hypothetical protein